ncbi:fibronectin type III domain-containing protein [Methanofollis tationis]|uniref:Fibronectin type III domain-containing protein n=1 Tax=Methanofollis tationis TaxID=81417 RepID=A0A7K4HP62_9EURY|nr:fibronectin type III domain-containing protein [Methanofollis tationis]NVO66847.1 fibronectin type III domain-containing protein [Methanofollis tationis]
MNPQIPALILILSLLIAPAAADKVVITAQIGLAITNLTVSAIGSDRAAVSWETDRNAAGWVDYGNAPGDYRHRMDGKTPGNRHQIALAGLPAGSTIYLRAGSAWMNLSAYSGEVAFSTLRSGGGGNTLSIAVPGVRPPVQTTVVETTKTAQTLAAETPAPTGGEGGEDETGTAPFLVALILGALLLAAVRWQMK